MQVNLTIGERLKDLRVERKLTLEQLADEVGISKSALGKYESDNGKDISPYSIAQLADYYGVSSDYLMGRTEIKNHPNTALDDLHLSDGAVNVLKTGNFNHRLLSEIICHKDFQPMMLDAEIYVDRIADMRIHDMNAVLEAVRHTILAKNKGESEDLHLRTLVVAQVQEEEYFGHVVSKDMASILHDIRDAHKADSTTADQTTTAEKVQQQLEDAMNFEGSADEKKAKLFLSNLGIDYDAITMEQFVTLIDILKLSKHTNSPISQRGKSAMTHGKGKRKK
jgi:transcriptional regulator with XRE-family HTH domain